MGRKLVGIDLDRTTLNDPEIFLLKHVRPFKNATSWSCRGNHYGTSSTAINGHLSTTGVKSQ